MTSNPTYHSSFSICLWNANVLKQHHSNELFYLIHNKNIDIALITETHLSKYAIINFNGYTTIRADHPDGTSHGGFAIIIKSSLFHNQMQNIKKSYLQATNIKIKINHLNVTISSAYFPPGQKISEPKLQSFFQSLGSSFIIGGDLMLNKPNGVVDTLTQEVDYFTLQYKKINCPLFPPMNRLIGQLMKTDNPIFSILS